MIGEIKMETSKLQNFIEIIGEEMKDHSGMGHVFSETQERLIAEARINALKKCFPGSKEMKVRVTFIESTLGMSPNDRDIYRDYIASKAPNALDVSDEIAAVGIDAVEEKGMTVFPRNEKGEPCSFDYQWKGFMKDACSLLSRAAGKDPETGKKIPSNYSSKLTAFKKVIDGNIFVYPRMIKFDMHNLEMSELSRPLRADTPQGPRTALAKSEMLPAGATAEFNILCMNPADEKVVEEWLSYGVLHGFGQWRNGGFGTFVWEKLEDWHSVNNSISEKAIDDKVDSLENAEKKKPRGRKKKE